jgi:hypothetical protein
MRIGSPPAPSNRISSVDPETQTALRMARLNTARLGDVVARHDSERRSPSSRRRRPRTPSSSEEEDEDSRRVPPSRPIPSTIPTRTANPPRRRDIRRRREARERAEAEVARVRRGMMSPPSPTNLQDTRPQPPARPNEDLMVLDDDDDDEVVTVGYRPAGQDFIPAFAGASQPPESPRRPRVQIRGLSSVTLAQPSVAPRTVHPRPRRAIVPSRTGPEQPAPSDGAEQLSNGATRAPTTSTRSAPSTQTSSSHVSTLPGRQSSSSRHDLSATATSPSRRSNPLRTARMGITYVPPPLSPADDEIQPHLPDLRPDTPLPAYEPPSAPRRLPPPITNPIPLPLRPAGWILGTPAPPPLFTAATDVLNQAQWRRLDPTTLEQELLRLRRQLEGELAEMNDAAETLANFDRYSHRREGME